MKTKIRGAGLRVTGLVLGIIATTIGALAIIFSAVGLHQSHLCKVCNKGVAFK